MTVKPSSAQTELARQIVNRQMPTASQAKRDKATREVAALIATGHRIHT